MSGKYKTHRRAANRYQAKAARALRDAKTDTGLHNRHGGGALLPSQLGWGQRKADKSRITLPNIWRS
ncbi:hypothetical protein NKJ06_21130 [Mesorhizobium sp. M0293]|uniref:hypothetical protein n=1 Tax=Mesorhizobium sp. M0293 TaxID=2956930 RepID=UPI00333C819B